MCWNISVSVSFGLIHLITMMIVIIIKPYHYRKFITFLLFYLIMEWFQALQWYLGVKTINNDICPPINTYLTIFAYILIWIQPIMFASFTNNKRFVRYYAMLTFIICMINLFLGFKYPAQELDSITFDGSANYGNQTCTYLGKYGHLLWKFKINTLAYQPTHYVYYSLILLTFILYYDRILKYTLGLGWIISLILTIFIHGVNNELPSFWCLLSICADIPIILYSILSWK
jgi:uncharacterized membrane protein